MNNKLHGSIILTYRCNARCNMCNVWEHPTKTSEEIGLDVIEKLPQMFFCNITGGEPFVRQDLPEIVDILRRKSKRIVISTNGYFTERIIELCKRYPDAGIRISIEGLEEANDKIRGIPDGYKRTQNTLRKLQEMGIKDVGFAMTVQDMNYKDLVSLYKMAYGLGYEFATATTHNSHYFHKWDNKIENKEEIIEAFRVLIKELLKSKKPKEWFRAYFNYGLINYIKGNQRLLPCEMGQNGFFLDPWGDILPCNGMDEKQPMGNLREQTWDEIWNSKRTQEVREMVKDCKKNCWMIGSAAPAIWQYPIKPILWVLRHKLGNRISETRTTPLKVCVLGTRGFPNVQGGVEAHCENLYSRLRKNGCEVTVFTRRPYVDKDCNKYDGVKLIPLSCPKNKFLEAFLHTLYGVFAARKLSPDILHIHAIGPSLFVPLARLLGLKVVMTNHGPDYERKKWSRLAKVVLKFGEKLGSKWANGIICISESISDRIKRKYNRDATIIPNGVIMPQISQNGNIIKEYGLYKGKYILSVGRFVPEKGFDCLVEAFEDARINTNCTQIGTNNWKLVIVGDADHPDRYSLSLKEKASKNGNAVLTGFLNGEPLKELYSHAGLFVLPSYYEGLPIVLLEAMSYGLSCIASDIPANRDMGLSKDRFFQAGDIQALATKIKEFIDRPLTDEEKREQIGMVAEKYDWKKIADRTLEVYKQVAHS